MTRRLQYLLERARRVQMSTEERDAQRRSFAYGNGSLDEPTVTRAAVAAAERHEK